jgi:hypothetical protein
VIIDNIHLDFKTMTPEQNFIKVDRNMGMVCFFIFVGMCRRGCRSTLFLQLVVFTEVTLWTKYTSEYSVLPLVIPAKEYF